MDATSDDWGNSHNKPWLLVDCDESVREWAKITVISRSLGRSLTGLFYQFWSHSLRAANYIHFVMVRTWCNNIHHLCRYSLHFVNKLDFFLSLIQYRTEALPDVWTSINVLRKRPWHCDSVKCNKLLNKWSFKCSILYYYCDRTIQPPSFIYPKS